MNSRKKHFFHLFYFLLISFFSACQMPSNSSNQFASVIDQQIVDSQGRVLILNGINHVNKNPQQGYMHDNDEELFKQFRKWGFNAIRYGIIWDGIEPEPGKINEAYLQELDKRVKWAEENDLYLILDMHQDLFSREYADGAPIWASLHDDLPHITGDVWSDAYLMSPAVHRCFDNFWANTPASDGVGIQDHYIHVWKKIAQRYAQSPSVIGFDLMNEPFMGSGATAVLGKMLEAYGAVLAQNTGQIPTEKQLLELWSNEQERIKALDHLNDPIVYQQVMNHAEATTHHFEKQVLTDFYQRLRDTIRQVNKNHLLFLEHNYFSNLGIKSTFKIPTDEQGIQDQLCVYAPHGYDLVTDTKGASNPGEPRVESIFSQIFLSAKEKQAPVLIGEWGAFYMGDNYQKPAEQIVSIVEQNSAGQTYWAWWPKIETQDYFLTRIVRPYPMNIAAQGAFSYVNKWDNQHFICQWMENGDENIFSKFFIPHCPNDLEKKMKLTPASPFSIIRIEDSNAAYLEIQNVGGERSLSIQF